MSSEEKFDVPDVDIAIRAVRREKGEIVSIGFYYRGGKRITVKGMPVDQVDRLLEWKMASPAIQRALALKQKE